MMMKIFDILKRGIKSLIKSKIIVFQDNQPEKNNHIYSSMVDSNALIGHDITVQIGAYICRNTTIDSYSYVGFNSLISKTTIGRYNSIANNVNIGHGEHKIDAISTSSLIVDASYEELTNKPCVIQHDVWIGSGATIRRGVTLGTGCVVGANSFVNKDVPPYAVVGGVPAKILKYRFQEEKINKVLQSKWWELELEEAKIKIQDFKIEK